jgi:hypothetical protein
MVPLHIQLASSTLRKVIKRLHYPLEVMLVCVRWYAAYPLSLRNLEEMMAERGVIVDHATVHRWALKILPVLATVFRRRKRPVGSSWRVDETYIKVGRPVAERPIATQPPRQGALRSRQRAARCAGVSPRGAIVPAALRANGLTMRCTVCPREGR